MVEVASPNLAPPRGSSVTLPLVAAAAAAAFFIGMDATVKLLGVRWETLKQVGAVSAEVVREMAQGARRAFNTDIGLSVSCIAGPGGATPTKPVGTSWCGISFGEQELQYLFQLQGSRQEVKEQLAQKALESLLDILQEAH